MSETQENGLVHTLDKIFANVENVNSHVKRNALAKSKKVNKHELELAMTVLMVELASCDQQFQPEEYHMIANGLRRLFGTSREQVQALVNEATQVLRNLRGTSHFGNLLKENLNEEQRIAVMDVIEDIIHADGVVEGFEIYLRHKFADLLGMKIAPLEPEEAK